MVILQNGTLRQDAKKRKEESSLMLFCTGIEQGLERAKYLGPVMYMRVHIPKSAVIFIDLHPPICKPFVLTHDRTTNFYWWLKNVLPSFFPSLIILADMW